MVIQSVPNPSTTLDADSILCSADRKVIGKVFETFGPVVQPMYSVRYDPAVSDLVMSVGDQVYFVKEMAKYVFAAQLRLLKGSDASNRDDEEIAVDEMEFSDDEQEAEYKRQLKLKKKRKGEDDITDPQVDNAESRLNPRSQRGTRGGGRGGRRSSFDDHRGGRGGGGFTGRGSYESSRGGYDGSRSASNYSARGNHNSHSTSQPPRSTHALPPKPHALPPRPTSANIPLSTGLHLCTWE
ncbi:hypothetical protein BCR33DRAFT_6064 [Rhizoclosmatium globosum]|uniref:H/ACA ribonucleoprotein complex subunit n=1 Tax=Rhizoclosmatium globosum TaxID=329046 RepID=A0A1Y2D519_9FUNG|nr:hypothetical protein BCR33DRAFT_6064 [Rhizoclosmatium globosum]|eukprot:ORY53675.1 hypothetical protein BCR33DRAFT_6064 [Rhizoclosmatium globosum]